jgi:hypothetical protein
LVSLLDLTITDKELPSGFPFRLTANDPALILLAPGLSKFGNDSMAINIAQVVGKVFWKPFAI